MCSMSTGHCSTHAPQVVHDHSTSGSITPPCSAVPTSGRAACSGPEPPMRSKPFSGTWWPASGLASVRSMSMAGASLLPSR
ncbi:hypothetical protein C1Y40_03549 [Mycobacterium talmoniae]|uniref:Uncharacterized protein n=1 Tax=Mycobacterium talmoniae TaxID=1858794 RepID=A0A2S8BI05_9MYCO|nr:hypothetical protein C1Y40_03549 [Mycobacterium talmoniae]